MDFYTNDAPSVRGDEPGAVYELPPSDHGLDLLEDEFSSWDLDAPSRLSLTDLVDLGL